ncbi:MAG: 2-hydroxychromene-2-carboxylate isomerase [Rhodocyclaceae bacterium]|nr:2-hydroxychromene-2-carboxylate isomerase [Rhodocyclaceae bacterium]
MQQPPEHAADPAHIEIWFDFGSPYSYPSVMRIDAAAKSAGLAVAWRPFLLGPIFASMGWPTSPFVLYKAKGAYMWRDIARQCRKYGLPWRQPSVFPRRALLATRVALLGASAPWVGPFCQQVMQQNFVEDREIDSPGTIAEVLDALALPTARLLSQACADDTKAGLRRRTEDAMARGIFGAPSFFVGEEMFWGDDRLDDALARGERCDRAGGESEGRV